MSLKSQIEKQMLKGLLFATGGGRWVPSVRRDGRTLDPQLRVALLADRLMRRTPYRHFTPPQARADMARIHASMRDSAHLFRDVGVRGLRLDLTDGRSLDARLYAPPKVRAKGPILLYFHGGGFVVGDLDTQDGFIRRLCAQAGVPILSVAYRLAPEHPFPAGVEDALASFQWLVDHAPSLGVSPDRIAVGGDSAGGTLAAVVSRETTAGAGPAPIYQLLYYPVTDMGRAGGTRQRYDKGFGLTGEMIAWFNGHYLGDHVDPTDPRASPLLAERHDGLPPTCLVSAGFDPLLDEDEDYVRALEAAGVPVIYRRYDRLIHGFIGFTGVIDAAASAVDETAAILREALLSGNPEGTTGEA